MENPSHLTGSLIQMALSRPSHTSPTPWQLPDNMTNVELTVSHSKLIVSDSELTFPHIPFILYAIYISLESYWWVEYNYDNET